MSLIHASFSSIATASQALEALRAVEIPLRHSSLVTSAPPSGARSDKSRSRSPVEVNALATAIAAGAVEERMVATPSGLLAAGALEAALRRAHTGDMAGDVYTAFVATGAPEEEAREASRAIEAGGVLAVADVSDEDVVRARAVLHTATMAPGEGAPNETPRRRHRPRSGHPIGRLHDGRVRLVTSTRGLCRRGP